MVSVGSTFRVMWRPVRALTKICIPPSAKAVAGIRHSSRQTVSRILTFFYFGSSLSVSVNSYFICRAVKSRCMTESAIVRMSSAAMVCRISEICASGT